MSRRLVVEADGGARGNPGPAAYGAVVRDPLTGEVLSEVASTIGAATNNVAEYRGLIAGLEAAQAIDPAAAVEVRLDSKLVVEQMSGRWKIKNADLRSLADRAGRIFPGGQVSYRWVPRAQNTHADRLLNAALDAGGVVDGDTGEAGGEDAGEAGGQAAAPQVLGGTDPQTDTTLLLVRHGQTADTVARRFAGGGVPGADLDPDGQLQAAHAAAYVELARPVAIVTSPLRRTRQTAQVIADRLGVEPIADPAWRECEFGDWEGLAIDEVIERHRDMVVAWRGSSAVAPPGGESLDTMWARVEAATGELLDRFRGQTVVAVTHSLPIRALVCRALGAPIEAIHHLRPAPGSVTELVTSANAETSITGFGLRPG